MTIIYSILGVLYAMGGFVWLGMGYRSDGFRLKDLITVPTILLFWPLLLSISLGMAIHNTAEEIKKGRKS